MTWFYVYDEYEDHNGVAERPIAGPFDTAEDAAIVLHDVAYPFSFLYGPATIVGDVFIGEGGAPYPR